MKEYAVSTTVIDMNRENNWSTSRYKNINKKYYLSEMTYEPLY